jgi:hypothetical protein
MIKRKSTVVSPPLNLNEAFLSSGGFGKSQILTKSRLIPVFNDVCDINCIYIWKLHHSGYIILFDATRLSLLKSSDRIV